MGTNVRYYNQTNYIDYGLYGSPSLKMGNWKWFVWFEGLMRTWPWCA